MESFLILAYTLGFHRYKHKRTEEDLEVVKRKAAVLEAEKEGSIIGKLQEELKEYKEILKCRVCHDRPKEVIILIITSILALDFAI